MAQPASVGTLSRCALGTASPPTVAFEYKQFGLKLHQELTPTSGIRGTHNHPAERLVAGPAVCSGSIVLQPGPLDFDTILPFVTGTATKAVNVFALTESLIAFNAIVDRVAEVYQYTTTYVDTFVLHCAQGEPVEVTMQCEALTETSTTFPTAAYNYQAPYQWYQGALTIGGTTYQFLECTITIHNNLKKDRFMNSVTRTDLPFMDRIIECEIRMPCTSDQAALLSYPGVTAESFSLVLTQGAYSLTLASSAFQIEPQSPDLSGREEILLPLRGQLREASAGTVAPLTITNVS